ncbi:MAG: alpha/beta fold hydrolase [Gaiellaceae bacterium]
MRRSALVLLALAAAVCAPSLAHAGDFTKTELRLTMSDGVQLAVTYFQPVGTPPAAGWPAVVLLHGIGVTRNTSDFVHWTPNLMAAQFLAPEGYAVLTYDARAHGQSGGQFTLDGPRELADLRELLNWLTTQHPVDAAHVGAYGASYGGGLVWKAAVEGLPLAAIAPAATWTDLREALAPQSLVRAGIILGFAQSIPRERYGPEESTLLTDAIAERNVPAIRAYLATRSTRPQLASVTVPTFMLQGRRDFAFDADQAIAAYNRIKGPKRLYIGDLGHTPATNPSAEFEYVSLEMRAWFDRFLKGMPNGIDTRAPIELAPDPWRTPTTSYRTLPKPRTLTFRFAGRSALSDVGKVVRTTKRVAHMETFGTPAVKVSLSSPNGYRHLVAVLSALTPSGSEIVVADGGADTQAVGRRARTVTIRLQNEITAIPAQSRLRVTLGARSTVQNVGNLVYLIPVPDGSRATVGKVTLTVPVLRKPISP